MDTQSETCLKNKKNSHPLKFALWLIISILIITLTIRSAIHHYQNPQEFQFSAQALKKSPWKKYTIKSGDTLASMFKRIGLSISTYKQIIVLKKAQPFFKKMRPHEAIYILMGQHHRLKQLVYHDNSTQYLVIRSEVDKKGKLDYRVHLIQQKLGKRLQTASGTIRQSLSKAAEVAGLPTNVLYQLTDIFGWEISFKHSVRSGDQFKVIYDTYYAGKHRVKTGTILVAEFINHHKKYIAIRYQNKNKTIGYYSPDGKNLKEDFLRAPIKYKYVSSPFAARRYHPILHIVRAHEGVDLAAPTGTPIKASGNGRIIFRGRRGGYGKAIIIHHNRKYTTLYAHMSRFKSDLHVGSRVKEGQVIGYVGQTGLATGPHLHYEFHIYGVPHDPMTVKLPHAAPIPRSEHKAFIVYAKKMIELLNQS